MTRTARIATKVEKNFREKLDHLLIEAGWDESEYVRRAVEDYFPKFVEYVQSIRTASA